MTPIPVSVTVERPPVDVFEYVTDPTRFSEWQAGVVSGCMDGAPTPALGAKCTTTRRIGGAKRGSTSELTRVDPPTRWASRGIDGPIRAIVDVTVEALDRGASSRVTISVDFEGHGIGRLLVPLIVRRQARREMPANMKRLRDRLETRVA